MGFISKPHVLLRISLGAIAALIALAPHSSTAATDGCGDDGVANRVEARIAELGSAALEKKFSEFAREARSEKAGDLGKAYERFLAEIGANPKDAKLLYLSIRNTAGQANKTALGKFRSQSGALSHYPVLEYRGKVYDLHRSPKVGEPMALSLEGLAREYRNFIPKTGADKLFVTEVPASELQRFLSAEQAHLDGAERFQFNAILIESYAAHARLGEASAAASPNENARGSGAEQYFARARRLASEIAHPAKIAEMRDKILEQTTSLSNEHRAEICSVLRRNVGSISSLEVGRYESFEKLQTFPSSADPIENTAYAKALKEAHGLFGPSFAEREIQTILNDGLPKMSKAERAIVIEELAQRFPAQFGAYLKSAVLHPEEYVALFDRIIPREGVFDRKIAAMIAENFSSFRIPSEADRFAIAERLVQVFEFRNNIHQFNLSADHRLALAKRFLDHPEYSVDGLWSTIAKFEIPDEKSRFELARQEIEQTENTKRHEFSRVLDRIANYKLSPESLSKLAPTAAKNAPNSFITGIQHFQISSPASRSKLILEAVEAYPASLALKSANESFAKKVASLANEAGLPDAAKIKQALGKKFAPELISIVLDRIENANMPLDDSRGIHDIQSEVRKLSTEYKVFSPAQAEMLWRRVKRKEVAIQLLKIAGRLLQEGRAVPEDSIDILAGSIGFSPEFAAALKKASNSEKISPNSLGDFYNVVLDLQLSLGEGSPPILKDVRLSSELAGESAKFKGLLKTLSAMRDLAHVQGSSGEAWSTIVKESFPLAKEVAAKDLGAIEARVARQTRDLIHLVFDGYDVSFTPEKLDALNERWDGIEPLLTLAARYNGKAEWRHENGILAKVFEAEVQNKFEDLKFRGPHSAQQLAMLRSPEAKAEWMSNPYLVERYGPQGASTLTSEQRQANVDRIYRLNLAPDLRKWLDADKVDSARPPVSSLSPREIVSAVLDVEKTSPKETFEKLKKRAPARVIVESIVSEISVARPFEESLKLASFLLANAKKLELPTAVKEDLNSLRETLEVRVPAERAIIFSTLSHDPKLLMTVGELVNDSSCQSYRCGHTADTLPGYVIDANVRLFASFVVKQHHFASPREFSAVDEALGAGRKVDVRFDGAKRIIHFKIGDREVSTKPLEHAHLRHILKVGTGEGGKAAVGFETEHSQSHRPEAEAIMRAHATSLLKEMARRINGTTAGPIRIEATANPNGVHSDKAGGAFREPYIIQGEAPAGRNEIVGKYRGKETSEEYFLTEMNDLAGRVMGPKDILNLYQEGVKTGLSLDEIHEAFGQAVFCK